jgi:hypothetical protein
MKRSVCATHGLEALTGQRQTDATTIRDYFAPLEKWLEEQNQGKPLGWQKAQSRVN